MGDVEMYDGLVSLIQELELMLRSHNRMYGDTSWPCCCSKQDIQIVYDEVSSMHSLLIENYDSNLMMENDIISAVHDAQDYVDSCVHGCSSDPSPLPPDRTIDDLKSLHSIIKRIDSIHKSTQTLSTSIGKSFDDQELMHKTQYERVECMGGHTADYSARILDILSEGSRLNIFAVIGGKGIGKNFIYVYETYYRLRHIFDIGAMLTIGRSAEVRDVLIQLLTDIKGFPYEINHDSGKNDLVQQLYECLRGRKYLIVLRDVHDYNKTWDDLKRAFPDDNNGSRIIVTSQDSRLLGLNRDAASTSVGSRFFHPIKELFMTNRWKTSHLQKYAAWKAAFAGNSFTVFNLIPRDPDVEGNLVGRDMYAMLDLLTGPPSKLKVFAVTGTGGIDKTISTKWFYDDPYVHFEFDIRAWFTISQHYQVREVLIGLLRCTTYITNGIDERSNEELSKKLYRSLKGKRYLIVLDDVWDKTAWLDLKGVFPDDENGSRIMLTTRFRYVAIHASPDTPPRCLYFLNLDESWDLLCSKIFGNESCPRELVSIGKNIAFLCRGLPLAIVLIGSYLLKMNKTTEIWNEVLSLIARGVILDDVEQEQGCRQASNIEMVITGAARCLHSEQENIGSMKKKLKNIQDGQEVLYKPPQNSQDTTSAGKFNLIGCFLSNMNKTFKEWKKAVSSLERGAKHKDVERVVGCRQGSNIETQTNIMDRVVGTVNSRCLRIQEKIDSIKNELKMIRNDKEVLQKDPQNLVDATPAGDPFTVSKSMYRIPNEEDKLVGHEEDLSTVLQHLIGHPPKLKVFAVTGMGGIGKTTFTKRLYNDPLVMYSFNYRAWFTISQQYRVREVLIGLLRCLPDVVDEIYEQSNEKLREQLYKSLKGKRYLIVLDDMWENNAWDDLKRIFPDDGNGSRILLTSRLKDVAIHASPDTPLYCLSLLGEDLSWELLRSKIFANESCPLELEPIGKQIAYKCHGLPLAIVVVGGLLSKLDKTLGVWQQFVENVSSLVMEKAEDCKNILALSYNHLPHHLKVCFLYLGIFPEDYVIPVQTLLWLWIAEGFIRPRKVKSLEELAEDYLENLISRNLIMVKSIKPEGRSKMCYIHDLLRDLCLTESHNQNFFHVFRSVERQDLPWEMQRRLCFQSNIPDHIISSSFPYIRSFLWFKTLTTSNNEKFLSMNFKLLKVMDIRNLHLEELPREVSGLAHLRYLAITFQDSVDRPIFSSTLHNLQILIIESKWNGRLPKEFWDMSEIRHLQFKRCFISYWPNESRPNILQLASASEIPQPFKCQLQIPEHRLKVLHNLQSLTTIRPISCTKDVFLSMPNLKKLGIYENLEDSQFCGWFPYLICLQELQTLNYIFDDPFVRHLMKPDPLPSWQFFPPKLMKLNLSGTSLPWEDMKKLSKLPNLEVLKLKNYAFLGTVWKSEDGGFTRLKYLLIGKTNLQEWEADGFLFPSLQRLVMMYCRSLKEIPCSIGKAPLLEKIELHYCSESAVTSAEQIQLEQRDFGNDGLTVYIQNDW